MFGKIYLVVFLIVSLIMLFNLLIAILSATYSYYETKGRGLYLHEVLGLWEDVQYAGDRGFLVMRNFPFHTLTLPFIPFFLCLRPHQRSRLDSLLQAIQFCSAIVVHLLFFSIFTALCMPFAYIKLVLHSISSVIRFKGSAHCRRIGLMFVYIFTGPFILALRYLADIWLMLYDDFQHTHTRDFK